MKIKKENISKKNNADGIFSSIVKFHIFLLKKSLIFWILSILLLISQPATIAIIYLMKLDILNFSFILNIVPLCMLVIWNIFIVNKFFSETRFNSIDVIMLSKPISKIGIFFSRFIIIFIPVILIMFIQFLISSILIFAFFYNVIWIVYLIISNLLIQPIILILLSGIFILFAVTFKPLLFGLSSFLALFFISCAPVLSRMTQPNHAQTLIEYDNEKYNSFSELIIIDGNNDNSFLVNQVNINSQNDVNKNILKTINSVPIYDYLLPGELMLSMNSSLIKSLGISSPNLQSQFSLLKNKYISVDLQNDEFSFDYMFSIRPEDDSPLIYDSISYENILIDNISDIVASNEFIDLNDPANIAFLQRELTQNSIWINSPQLEPYMSTIKALLGIDVRYSQLFYYFNNLEFLGKKTPNLLNLIEQKFSLELKELLLFLWTNPITKINLFNFKVFGDVWNIYPNTKIEDLNEKPTINDINFIKNDLIRFSGNEIAYLDSNNNYILTNLTTIQAIDPSIVNEATWHKYIDSNSFTLSQIKQVTKLLEANLPNIMVMQFEPNWNNMYKYSYYLKKDSDTYLDNSYLSIMSILFITIGTYIVSIYIFKNKNYKN